MRARLHYGLVLLAVASTLTFGQSVPAKVPVSAPAGASVATSGSESGAATQPDDDLTPNSNVELIGETTGLRAGASTTLAFRITLDRGWHTYFTNAGDAGLPLGARWSLPPGVTISDLRFPAPHLIPLPPLMSFGYENEVFVLADVTVAANVRIGTTLLISADVDFLVCADVCLPASAHLVLNEKVVETAAPSRFSSSIAATRTRLAQSTGSWNLSAWREGNRVVLVTRAPAAQRSALQQVFFIPDSSGVLEHALPQTFALSGDSIILSITAVPSLPDSTSRLQGLLLNDAVSPTEGFRIDVPLARTPPAGSARIVSLLAASGAVQSGGVAGAALAGNVSPYGESAANSAMTTTSTDETATANLGVWLALVLAFGGGLLLNVMPCVFPVLSVKILAFVEHGGDHSGSGGAQNASSVGRKHALVFTLGVLVTFWALAGVLFALRAGGAQLGWGFQLQSPGFVAAVALVVFALALNMSGVFTIGASLTRLGAVGSGARYADSFFTGLLAVIVATPCTAPFMGAALGFALVQPAIVGLAVFTALGLGLAAPYVIFASSPALLKRLPRPGAWLETLKQLLAFPLYATVVWLLWVLGRQSGSDLVALTLLITVVVAFAAWMAGRSQLAGKTLASKLALGLLAVSIVAGGAVVGMQPSAPATASAVPVGWELWSPARTAEARTAGRVVFVDFTAAWCLSCQVNERVALHTTAVEKAFADANVVLLRADWTARNPEITTALAEFGRSGVPLYVIYPADATKPADILPAILTPGLVVDAIGRARGVSVAAGQ